MAFTDPILSGTELVRSAITSDDYVPGTSGWAIHKNGAAEFANATVRQTLTVGNDIILRGRSLANAIDSAPIGCVAWIRGYPVESTTTEKQIMYTEMQVVSGRFYEVFLTNITPDIGNAKATEFKIRWVVGTGSFPDNNSSIIAMTLRLSPFENGNARAMFCSGYTGIIRLRASITSLDGQNVRCWAPGGGCILGAYDLGVSPSVDPGIGIIGSASPGKTLKEFTISSNFCKSYRGTGGGSGFNNFLAEGDFNWVGEDYIGWWTFVDSDRWLIEDMIGVPESDILTADCQLDCLQWNGSNGTVILGYHNTISLGAGLPGGGIYDKLRINYSGSGSGWFNLKAGGFGAGTIMDGIKTGYLKGLLIGKPGSSAMQYSGVFESSGATRPTLHMKYYK